MLNHNHSPMMLLTINLECRLISSLFYVSQPVLPAENVLTDMVKTPAGSTRTRIDAAQLSIWKVRKVRHNNNRTVPTNSDRYCL